MRPLALDLSWLAPDQLELFDEAVVALETRARPSIVFGTGHLLIAAVPKATAIGIGYDLLPAELRPRRRNRLGLPELARRIVGAIASPAARRTQIRDGSEQESCYVGWNRLRHIAEQTIPDFLSHNPHAHPGSPWRPARCEDPTGRALLPQAVVDHAFADCPHVLEFSSVQHSGEQVRILTRHDGPLAFDHEPVDPIAAMRTWADLPDEVRKAA